MANLVLGIYYLFKIKLYYSTVIVIKHKKIENKTAVCTKKIPVISKT